MIRNPINISDKNLVEKVLQGDSNAYINIIKLTENIVASITWRMIPNAADRKDLAQDIYLKAYRSLDTFKFESRLTTWIARITYNTCINFLDKKGIVFLDAINDELNDNSQLNQLIVNEAAPDKRLHQKELAIIFRNEVAILPPVYKTLISLYHYEELSYDEIGQITSLPPGTIKNYLFRARKLLKQNLLKNYKPEEL